MYQSGFIFIQWLIFEFVLCLQLVHKNMHFNIILYLTIALRVNLIVFSAYGAADDGSMGPVFMREPPNRVDFSNTTGAQVECSARGSPAPEIIWVRADGTAVGDVPGLRQVRI